MIFNRIWERYFLSEIVKVFILFLFCFYGLYVLIDYASHTSALANHHIHIHWKELARYYLYIFSSRAEFLVPLALLIASIKTLCTLNVNQELVALMASGIRLKTLMRPFLFVGLFCTALLFLNEQLLLPSALKKLRRIEDATKHQRGRNHPPLAVKHLNLEDGSLFLFQSYDSSKEEFFDAFWIRSIDNIYRMKYVAPYAKIPVGQFVDHFTRQTNGELIQTEAFKNLPLNDLRFNAEILQSTLQDPDALSIPELWQQLPSSSDRLLSEKESKLLTAFYWKLTLPWFCLLAVLAPIPFCIYFSRQLPVFFIYVCGIFGLIAFYLFMEASSVVAKRQVIHPIWAICFPFFANFSFFGWRFIKMK